MPAADLCWRTMCPQKRALILPERCNPEASKLHRPGVACLEVRWRLWIPIVQLKTQSRPGHISAGPLHSHSSQKVKPQALGTPRFLGFKTPASSKGAYQPCFTRLFTSTHMYIHIYIDIHIYTHICIYIYIYICIYIYTCIFYTHKNVRIAYVRSCRIRMHLCVHTYIRTYTDGYRCSSIPQNPGLEPPNRNTLQGCPSPRGSRSRLWSPR